MSSDEQTKIIISYGDLIDLYESASDDHHFIKKFHEAFPSYNLSRPKRLIETVHRIVAPTKPSLRGPSKLNGSSLLAYRRRMWKPHVPNPIRSSSDIQFPVKLHSNYGLDEALLVKCFDAVKSAIDSDFAEIRPDNVYRYVESLCEKGTVSSLCCSTEQNSSQENDIGDSVSSLSAEVLDLRQKRELSKKKLALANSALKDITNEKIKVHKERDSAVKRATRYHKANTAAMNDIENLIEEFDASESFSADSNDSMFSPDVVTANNIGSQDFTSTKSGKTYSNSVRKLYYTLLSSGIPVKKVETLVKDVVKWSNPSVDVSKLELPKRSCASYIRKEELKVISNTHKASSL
uniref:Uncharacterized protein n=1 Tax=Amphimedon queenslandica TaxID=400682 RepID=A0A1X7U376_AMPQE